MLLFFSHFSKNNSFARTTYIDVYILLFQRSSKTLFKL